MNRYAPVLTALAIAGMLATGCSKSSSTSSEQGPGAAASGPISDSADSGLKPKPGQAVAATDPKHGEAIFSQNCSSCHGAAGVGGGIGPKLKGEKSRKDQTAAVAWIKNPKPPMPKLYPSPLSESDVSDVAAYVETL